MNGGVAQEGALLRWIARQSRRPLVTVVRRVTLVGSGVNLAPRRPVEGVTRERGFVGQIDGIAQGALRIARIGSSERSVDRNHRAGVAVIEQVVQSQNGLPV